MDYVGYVDNPRRRRKRRRRRSPRRRSYTRRRRNPTMTTQRSRPRRVARRSNPKIMGFRVEGLLLQIVGFLLVFELPNIVMAIKGENKLTTKVNTRGETVPKYQPKDFLLPQAIITIGFMMFSNFLGFRKTETEDLMNGATIALVATIFRMFVFSNKEEFYGFGTLAPQTPAQMMGAVMNAPQQQMGAVLNRPTMGTVPYLQSKMQTSYNT